MYTLEEIEEEAKSKFWKTFFWTFLIVVPISTLHFYYWATTSIHAQWELDHMKWSLGINVILIILLIFAVGTVPSSVRKKMLEENAEEERQNREEHYRKVEEMLEKMQSEKKE